MSKKKKIIKKVQKTRRRRPREHPRRGFTKRNGTQVNPVTVNKGVRYKTNFKTMLKKVEEKEKKDNFETEFVSKKEVGSKVNEFIEGLENAKNIYVRGTNSNDLFSEKSIDPLLDPIENEWANTREEAEHIIEKHNKMDTEYEIIELDKSKLVGDWGKFGVQYKGINALTDYDANLMDHNSYIYVFEGKNLGTNMVGDGDIIKPIRVLKCFELTEN